MAPLNILYEDQWLIVVDKPAGQMVHPADHPQEGDEVTMKILRDQIGQHIYTIHRLDRPTTGVLLFAKDQSIAKKLHADLAAHHFNKTYYAVTYGESSQEKWENYQGLRKTDGAPEKEAHTSFKTLKVIADARLSGNELTKSSLSLIEATPHTGRYHQIRRHLESDLLPIVGDYRYAGIDLSNQLGELLGTGTRMLLQAKKLEFTHPVNMEPLIITAETDPMILKCFPGA